MSFKIDKGKLIVDLDLKSTALSKSGKTYMVAGSGGFSWVSDGEGGEIGVSYNVVRRKD